MTIEPKTALPTKREVIDYLNELDSSLFAESDAEGLKTFKVSIDYDDDSHEITGFVGNEQEDDDDIPVSAGTATYRITILGCCFSWEADLSSRDAGERVYNYPELKDGEPILDEKGKPVDMTAELENALNVCVDTLSPYGGDVSATPEAIEKALLDASSPTEDNFYVYDDIEDKAPVFYYEVPEEVPEGLRQIDIATATDILFSQELPVEMLY